jgi:hypothetical protein
MRKNYDKRKTDAFLVEFNHFEVVLGDAAVRAGPGVGDIFPAGTGFQALIGESFGLVIDEAADDAHPFAQGAGIGGALAHFGSGQRGESAILA